MSLRASTDRLLGDIEIHHGADVSSDIAHPDDCFGGPEKRKRVEQELLRKLDLRVFFLVLVALINYVSPLVSLALFAENLCQALDGQG